MVIWIDRRRVRVGQFESSWKAMRSANGCRPARVRRWSLTRSSGQFEGQPKPDGESRVARPHVRQFNVSAPIVLGHKQDGRLTCAPRAWTTAPRAGGCRRSASPFGLSSPYKSDPTQAGFGRGSPQHASLTTAGSIRSGGFRDARVISHGLSATDLATVGYETGIELLVALGVGVTYEARPRTNRGGGGGRGAWRVPTMSCRHVGAEASHCRNRSTVCWIKDTASSTSRSGIFVLSC
jgi:hypothetical protein